MAIEVYVNEYIQVAHRLTKLPGKCQNIHGHSMRVFMYLQGKINEDGLIQNESGEILDFSAVKKVFRKYLSDHCDHHLMLNAEDPYVHLGLKGTTTWPGDPTTENIAMWIYTDMRNSFPVSRVEIEETETNGVIYDEGP
jgi:6-pyruvoyltetrahydropterin/6-carboxytetrahydropterin synthase